MGALSSNLDLPTAAMERRCAGHEQICSNTTISTSRGRHGLQAAEKLTPVPAGSPLFELLPSRRSLWRSTDQALCSWWPQLVSPLVGIAIGIAVVLRCTEEGRDADKADENLRTKKLG